MTATAAQITWPDGMARWSGDRCTGNPIASPLIVQVHLDDGREYQSRREAHIDTDDDLDIARGRSVYLLNAEGAAVPGGILCVLAGLVGTVVLFAPRVDPIVLGVWLTYMIAVVLGLGTAHVWAKRRKPAADEYLSFWGPLGRGLNFALVLGTIASIWIFMPATDDTGRLFLVTVYIWFVVVQMLVHAEGMRFLTISAIAGVFGSLMAYLFFNPMPYGLEVVGVLVVMAASMVGLQGKFREAVRDAIEARVQSEVMTRARDRALADVIVERDTKTRFLESASHDLRQPLQAARMFVDQALDNQPGIKRDKAIASLHWALDATDTSLTHILDYLRLDAGEVKPDLKPLEIGPLLAHLVDFNEPHSRLANTAIKAVSSGLSVLADRRMTERALANLVGNALRHASADRILIGARRSGRVARIWVIDNGVGTTAGDRDNLFDDYFQGSDHGGALRGGFGLGLATVRRLATLMNGTAGLEGRWVRGSAFWLELPIHNR